jgi:hypothetical protein
VVHRAGTGVPPTNPAPEPSLLGSFLHGRLRWLYRLPPVVSWHATASTGPRFHEDGQTARPGNRKGYPMTEAAVSFAGNLTADSEVRSTEGGIARAMFRVAVSGRREQEASFFTVVVWRDQAEHAAQSLAKGSRGGGRGPTPAAGMDHRGRQRPLDCRGRGRGARAKPSLGNGDDDQDDEELQPAAPVALARVRRTDGWGSRVVALQPSVRACCAP